MPIDFSQIAKPQQVVVPILGGSFQYKKKQYKIKSEDGWHLVELEGNRAKAIMPDSPSYHHDQAFKRAKGFTCNNRIVFDNADVAMRHWGFNLEADLHFNQSMTFEPVQVVVWESGTVFWEAPDYGNLLFCEFKAAYDEDRSVENFKGVTPEMRAVYLIHALERDQLREMMRVNAAKEEHERLMKDTGYRLASTLRLAGGELIKWSQTGNRLYVDWKLSEWHRPFQTVLDAATWKVLECGICVSGDDRRHNLRTTVVTAKDYVERGLLHQTIVLRENEDEDDD